MNNKELKKYKSKIGIVVPIVYSVFIICGLIIWLVPAKTDDLLYKIIGSCILALVLIFFTWAVFSTYYVLTETCLICVSGPFKTRALYKDITDVTEGFSLLSSFSLSANRIFINRGRNILRRVDVSPKEKQEFLDELTIKMNKAKEQNY